MAAETLYLSEEHRREIERIKWLVDLSSQVICQEWHSSYTYKQDGDKDVLRIGHLDTLSYIEVPRHLLISTVRVDREWIRQFCIAAESNDKRYCGLIFYY